MLHTEWFLSSFRKGIETAQYLLAVPVFLSASGTIGKTAKYVQRNCDS